MLAIVLSSIRLPYKCFFINVFYCIVYVSIIPSLTHPIYHWQVMCYSNKTKFILFLYAMAIVFTVYSHPTNKSLMVYRRQRTESVQVDVEVRKYTMLCIYFDLVTYKTSAEMQSIFKCYFPSVSKIFITSLIITGMTYFFEAILFKRTA